MRVMLGLTKAHQASELTGNDFSFIVIIDVLMLTCDLFVQARGLAVVSFGYTPISHLG
jgi:hypothetical protein